MKGKKLDEDICQQIINLWMNYNYNQQKIADTLGIGYSTVRRTIAEYTQDGSHTPPEGMLPPAPVEKPQEIEQADKPVIMIEEYTADVPNAVIQAVADKIDTLSAILSDNLLTIKKMQQDNENLRSELAVLYGWRAEHEGAEN